MIPFVLAGMISMEFIGACSVKPLLKANVHSSFPHIGAATISLLDQFAVDYAGTEAGINSAFGTPTGPEAMDIISENEFRSYGWCYDVDGRVPEAYPNQVTLQGVRHVRWFFAYAHYLNGEWISQCEPAYKVRPSFLCGN
jgi:hypothetical protein